MTMDRNTNNTTYSKTNMNNHNNGVNVSGSDVAPGTGLCGQMWRRVRSWYRSWKGARAVPYLRLYKYADSVDVVLMVLGTIGGILNGISLPIMLLIQSHLIDNFGSHTNNPSQLQHKIAQDSLYFVFTALASWLACYLEVCCWMYAGERQASRIRSKYLQSILRQNVGFFDCETTTSEIVNSISADMLLVQEAISEKVGNFIKNFSHFVGGYIVAFSLLWKMASLMIPFTPILLLPGILYGVAIIEFTLRIQEAYAEANIVAEQAISSIRIVYSFVGEKRTLMAYYDSLSRVVDLGKKQGIAKGLAIGSHGIIFSMWSLLGWYGSILISHHQANGGQILTTGFAMITGGLALGNATPHIKTFFEGSVAAYKIFEMIDRVPLIDAYDNNGKEIENVQGDLEFNDVTFAYPSRSTSLILKNLKLKVPKGKTMALVGSSGSGKSTVISLVVRYYDPLSGEILLDGVNIKHLKLKWLRQQIGLVSQEPTLFGTSIKENILYGKGDATMDEITRVAELVGAHQFISKLPNGYDTQVGDRGVQLSGGQRQRIAIARALLRNPAILLLDEATSALDSDSEKHVQKALENVLMQGGGRTTLVVAHRLSTIHTSDAIAVLHNGALAEIGTHEELLRKKDGAYASLVRSQQKPNNSNGRGGEFWPQSESQMEKDFFISSPSLPSSPPQESLPKTRFDRDNGESCRNLRTQSDQSKTEYNNKDFTISTPPFPPSLSPLPQESLPQTAFNGGNGESCRKLLTQSDQLKTEHQYNNFTISTPKFPPPSPPPPSPSPAPLPQESLPQTGFNGGDEESCRKLPMQSNQSKTEHNKDFTISTPPPPPQESLPQTELDGGDRESSRKLLTPSEQPKTDNYKDLTISPTPFPPSPSPSPYPSLYPSPYHPLPPPPQESLPQTGLNGGERDDGKSPRKLRIVQLDQSETENHKDSTISTPPFPPSPSPSPSLSPSPPQPTQDVLPQNGHRRKAMETSTAKKKNGHFRRFVALSKPEWKHAVLGIAGAIAFGLVQPIYAYIVGSMVSTFYSSDMEKMRERTRVYSLIFLFLTLASFLVNYLQQYHFAVVGENLTRRIREMMLEKVLSFELAWFDQREHSSGALCSRLSSDANMVRTLFGDRISLVVQTMSGILVSVIIAMFNCWKLALVMTATQPLIIYCYYHRKVAQTKFAQQEAKAQEQACQVASEAVALHRTITAFSAQDKVLSHFDAKLEGTRRQTLKRSISSGMTIGAAQFTLLASWGLDFWYGGKLVEQGEATFGDIFKTFFILVSIGRVLAEAGTLTPDFAKGSRAVEFVFSILDRVTKIDGNNLPTNSMFGKQGEMEGHVEFREVDFAYPSRPNAIVFKNFNLEVSAGTTMALVGKSGCGKSTVISLMERFYDPLRGKVLVDGINIRDMHMHTLRQHIGLVNQEPTLFATSIRENIAYGKEGCSEEEIYRAARAANAHDFISALPNGYLTYAGEQGLQLSGGQKQRIAIARAILKDPKILLLDEATSALDAESELVVQKALDSMMANRTTLVVAHRLSTIKHAHYISVIKDGSISEQGSHQDLIALRGDYYYLLQLQTTSLSSLT